MMIINSEPKSMKGQELYNLTHPKTSAKISDLELLDVEKFAICEKEDGGRVLYAEMGGVVYASISKTFIESFNDIVLLLLEREWTGKLKIKVESGTSKSGNKFIFASPIVDE